MNKIDGDARNQKRTLSRYETSKLEHVSRTHMLCIYLSIQCALVIVRGNDLDETAHTLKKKLQICAYRTVAAIARIHQQVRATRCVYNMLEVRLFQTFCFACEMRNIRTMPEMVFFSVAFDCLF